MYLTRDAILGADDLEARDVDVPEWGGTVRVTSLSGKDRDAFEASMTQIRGGKTSPNLANVRAKLVARVVVDGDGERVFSDKDVIALGEKNAAPLDRIFDVARELSGMVDDSEDEAAESFDDGPSGGSTSS